MHGIRINTCFCQQNDVITKNKLFFYEFLRGYVIITKSCHFLFALTLKGLK